MAARLALQFGVALITIYQLLFHFQECQRFKNGALGIARTLALSLHWMDSQSSIIRCIGKLKAFDRAHSDRIE